MSGACPPPLTAETAAPASCLLQACPEQGLPGSPRLACCPGAESDTAPRCSQGGCTSNSPLHRAAGAPRAHASELCLGHGHSAGCSVGQEEAGALQAWAGAHLCSCLESRRAGAAPPPSSPSTPPPPTHTFQAFSFVPLWVPRLWVSSVETVLTQLHSGASRAMWGQKLLPW